MAPISQRCITKVASPRLQKEGGGFLVRKVIGGMIETCDPFIMLDHIGPVHYKPGEALGVPDHPHRGFECVTYVIDGGVKHEDSLGHRGELQSGWVQWMTAGKGIVHSEMPTDDLLRQGGNWEGFQLWVNLPAKDKMVQPYYQDRAPEMIPIHRMPEDRVQIKVLAGDCEGTRSSIKTHTSLMLLDISLVPGASFTCHVPETYRGFAYVWRGAGWLGADRRPLRMGQVGLLSTEGDQFKISAPENEECHVLLAAGEPIRESIVKFGPFVMNTTTEIQQAIDDYKLGRLGIIRRENASAQMVQLSAAQSDSDDGGGGGAAAEQPSVWIDRTSSLESVD